MEHWEQDFEWLRVRHIVAKSMNRTSLPDLQTILYLIGIQELGRVQEEVFTKEQKQDLMHVAVCTLLESEGYYEFEGRDHDGWPHFKTVKPFTTKGVNEQEYLLKNKVIHYFKDFDSVNPSSEEE